MLTTVSGIHTAEKLITALQMDRDMVRFAKDNPRLKERLMAELGSWTWARMLLSEAVLDLWRAEGRQTLVMHPEMARLARSAASDTLPVSIFRTLPYLTPMVVFPEPVLVPSALDGEAKELTGFIVYSAMSTFSGVRSRGVLGSHDPDADTLVIKTFSAIRRGDKVADVESDDFSLAFDLVASVHELTETVSRRFVWESAPTDFDAAKESLLGLVRTCLGSMLYLCSTTLEAERVPAKRVARHQKAHVGRKPMSLYQIGWTTGAAVQRLRQQRDFDPEPSQQQDLLHQQDPQHRRAHFKMQPHGPGHTQRKLIFVSPYWTHRERLGDAGVNTARKVVNG